MVSKGNHPQMAARFKLVKYYNLPRNIEHWEFSPIKDGELLNSEFVVGHSSFKLSW